MKTKNISKEKVVREINALGDVIRNKIDMFEKEGCNFQDEYNKGRYQGAIDGMKDMLDNLSRMAEELGLQ